MGIEQHRQGKIRLSLALPESSSSGPILRQRGTGNKGEKLISDIQKQSQRTRYPCEEGQCANCPSQQNSAAVRHAAIVLDMRALASLQIRSRGESLDLLLRHMAGAAHVFLGGLVVDEELAILAETVGLVAGDRDNVEDTATLLENCVHLLQGAVGSLGVEEVDHRKDESVTVGGC